MSKCVLVVGFVMAGWTLLGVGAEPISAQSPVQQPVQWRTNYDLARKEAREKNLPLVIDFGTEHCHYCRVLEKTTFRDPAVVSILRNQCVPVKVDGEKYKNLVKILKIEVYPTILFAAPTGKILDVQVGYVQADPFRKKLQKTLQFVRANFPNNPPTIAKTYPNKPLVAPQPTFPVPEGNIQLTSATQPTLVTPAMEKEQIARKMLSLAQQEFKTEQYLCCLTRCKMLSATFPGSPEAKVAKDLAKQIKQNPEKVHLACERLTDTLCELYLSLANHAVQNNQKEEAVAYLQWIVQVCPDAPYATIARTQLERIQK